MGQLHIIHLSIDRLIDLLTQKLIVRFTDWLTNPFTGWLIDWLTNLEIYLIIS